MEKRNDIYQGLKKHYGAFKQLAEKCDVSERWVLMVLSGQQQDEDLMLSAAKLWHDLEKQKKAKLEEADRFAEMALALAIS